MADPEKKIDVQSDTNISTRQPLDHHTSNEVVALGPDGFRLFPRPVIDDALDPLNWSWIQKHVILAIVMVLYFMFTYITTTTVPSFPDLQTTYELSAEQVNWTVAIPALGLAVGPLIWATPADIIGRRPIFILGTVIALASTIGAALAPNYAGYMAARFFQGLGVSPAANVGLAIINDLFFEHERGQKVGLWVMAIDLGLLFGPLIGGGVNLAGYQWIQWLSAIFFGAVLLAEVFFLPETLYPRTRLLNEMDSSLPARRFSDEKTHQNMSSDLKRTKKLTFVNVKPVPGVQHPKIWDTFSQFIKMFKYVVVPISVISYCFSWYWWVLSVVTLVPVAYPDYAPDKQGLLFIGLIVGTLISEIFFSGTLSDRIVVWRAKKSGNGKSPESRLWLAYPAAVLSAIGLIVWGISIDNAYHFMVGQVAFALFAAGIQMGNTAVCSYIVDAYPEQSMAVMTFYAVMLNLSAFIDPFFIIPWLNLAGFTWTFAGHAIITVFFCIPVLALLHRFGGTLRARGGSPNWVNP